MNAPLCDHVHCICCSSAKPSTAKPKSHSINVLHFLITNSPLSTGGTCEQILLLRKSYHLILLSCLCLFVIPIPHVYQSPRKQQTASEKQFILQFSSCSQAGRKWFLGGLTFILREGADQMVKRRENQSRAVLLFWLMMELFHHCHHGIAIMALPWIIAGCVVVITYSCFLLDIKLLVCLLLSYIVLLPLPSSLLGLPQ